MSTSPIPVDFDALERSIQTVTTLLSKGNYYGSAIALEDIKDNIPPILRHLSTLLTSGDKTDKDAKRVVAVTGTFDPGNPDLPKALLVAQNPRCTEASGPHPPNSVRISVHRMSKSPPSAAEILERANGEQIDHPIPLAQRLEDILNVFQARGEQTASNLEPLYLFALRRSVYKFIDRFDRHSVLWRRAGDRSFKFYESLRTWASTSSDLELESRLIELQGLTAIDAETLCGLQPNSDGYWEFSPTTLKTYVNLFRMLLDAIDTIILESKSDIATGWLDRLHNACMFLHGMDQERLLTALLNDTSMGELLNRELENSKNGDDDEEPVTQIHGWLKKILAWHTAVWALSSGVPNISELNKEIQFGVVDVSFQKHSLYSKDEIHERLSQYRQPIEDVHDETVEVQRRNTSTKEQRSTKSNIGQWHCAEYLGTVHAETTLMSILRYYRHTDLSNYNATISVTDDDFKAQLEDPNLAYPISIGVGKKCCWCCHWLGECLQGTVSLPGTHGILFPWSPPRVGVSIEVLNSLNDVLWKELYVHCSRPKQNRPRARRQSSGEDLATLSDPNWRSQARAQPQPQVEEQQHSPPSPSVFTYPQPLQSIGRNSSSRPPLTKPKFKKPKRK